MLLAVQPLLLEGVEGGIGADVEPLARDGLAQSADWGIALGFSGESGCGGCHCSRGL